MRQLQRLLPVALLLGMAGLLARPAYAHGFGERYDLPIPLSMFLIGAVATVALSFAVVGVFVRGNPAEGAYWRFNLFRYAWVERVLTSPVTLGVLKGLSVLLFLLVIATGIAGSQKPLENLAPLFVWVLWWVGMAYITALVGNLWALVNPWKIIFEWADALYARLTGERTISLEERYPQRWGAWPAVVLFFIFAWLENVFPNGAIPRNIAVLVLLYSLVTWAGMLVYGKEVWLRHGEAFTVLFGLMARFSPTEVRNTDLKVCRACPYCRDQAGGCVNCSWCFSRSRQRELNLRPYAAGLADGGKVGTDLTAFVILALSTVTFDGFTETSAWLRVQTSLAEGLSGLGANATTAVQTLGLVVFPGLFVVAYLGFCYLMSRVTGNGVPAGDMARAFVYSLVPIALAYHIAHFFSYLLIQGQMVVPLASDPFGFGWDLLGTASYRVNLTLVNARAVWFVSLFAIVLGHVLAVYVAHVMALRLFPSRVTAVRSQYPMLVLMVLYTATSLWIIAQPIVA